MFALRMLLMLVVTGERYGTDSVILRRILAEDSLRVWDDESVAWNDAYFDRLLGLGGLVEQHGVPEIGEETVADENIEEKSEDENAEQDESGNEETSTAVKSEETRKDEEELRFGDSWKRQREDNRPSLLDDLSYPKQYDPVRSAREIPECEETTTESFDPKGYVDYDSSGGGSDDKTSGGTKNVRGYVYLTGIVACSCFVSLAA